MVTRKGFAQHSYVPEAVAQSVSRTRGKDQPHLVNPVRMTCTTCEATVV